MTTLKNLAEDISNIVDRYEYDMSIIGKDRSKNKLFRENRNRRFLLELMAVKQKVIDLLDKEPE